MKSFKRILSVIIACTMLLALAVPFAAFADPIVEVAGGGSEGKPGDEVACNIGINGAKIGAVQLTVTFDTTLLEYTRVEIGDDIRNLSEDNPAIYLVNDNDAATGKLVLGAAITKGVEFDVAAVSIFFRIRNVEESAHTQINIQVDRLRDEEDNALEFTANPGSVDITVKHIESINFADESKELEIGEEYVPEYTVNPEGYTDAFNPVWSSDNDEIASVDENGKITALREGTANITITSGDISATLPVTVKAPAPQYKKGDMDKDGEITVADALRALRIAAKLAQPTDEDLLIGNVDGDDEITVALRILRVAAKLATEDSLQ